MREQLEVSPGLQAKTLFAWLQRRYPGRFQDGQLRTLQRRIRQWRATAGPPKEVFFAQTHHPGRLGASDFTHMTSLGVTIGGQPFDHMVYHFVLTYSNWETVSICFFGELREPQRWVAARAVGTGRRAPAASHGSDERGGEQSFEQKEFTGDTRR